MRPAAIGPVGAAALALALILGACGGRSGAEPSPPPPAPDLSGLRVMVLPVRAPAPGQIDAELAYWLTEGSPTTEWLFPDELQAAVDRAPAWRLRLDGLRRTVVDAGRGDRRVVDPLYGALRQLGAVVDADYAVVPVTTAVLAAGGGTAVGITAAIVDIRGGRVLWLHTLTGDPAPDVAAAAASAAGKLARLLAP